MWWRWFCCLRPLEWGVVAFILLVLFRSGLSVFAAYRELAGLRTVSVFCSLGVVGGFILARRFVATPWREGSVAVAKMHRLSALVAFAPLAAATFFAATTPTLLSEIRFARTAQLIPMLANVLLRVGGLGLPTLLFWLAIGLALKREGAVDLRRLVRTEGVAALKALRDWAPLLFILSAYAWMDAVSDGHHREGWDDTMAAIDRAMFAGRDPLELLERVISRPLSEWLAFAYSFYAVLFPLVLGAVFMQGGRRALHESSFALGSSLLIAYVLYVVFPVKGPVLSRSFEVSLELYLLASVKEAMMDATRITYDCFPSMHTCCSLLLGWSAFRYARRLWWVTLPIVASIPFACVYLRYHYVIDVVAGALLAVAAALVAPKVTQLTFGQMEIRTAASGIGH
jgi:membrane-associated phospholipid phosphatase